MTTTTTTTTCAAEVDVIFLDMDGVLLPFGDDVLVRKCPQLFPDETLSALTLILTHHPQAVLVLSSTWRVRPEYCHEIIQSFQVYGKQYGGPLSNIQEFYDITNVHNHSERSWEIHDWLALQTNVRAWIALDDEELVEGECNERHRQEFEGHVVKTKSNVGLTDEDAHQAVALLLQQIQCGEDNGQR